MRGYDGTGMVSTHDDRDGESVSVSGHGARSRSCGGARTTHSDPGARERLEGMSRERRAKSP